MGGRKYPLTLAIVQLPEKPESLPLEQKGGQVRDRFPAKLFHAVTQRIAWKVTTASPDASFSCKRREPQARFHVRSLFSLFRQTFARSHWPGSGTQGQATANADSIFFVAQRWIQSTDVQCQANLGQLVTTGAQISRSWRNCADEIRSVLVVNADQICVAVLRILLQQTPKALESTISFQ